MKTEKCRRCGKSYNSEELYHGECEWCKEYREGRGDD